MESQISFDLSGVPGSFFDELIRSAETRPDRKSPKELGKITKKFARELNNHLKPKLSPKDAVSITGELLLLFSLNAANKASFMKTKKRALFLPHCSRKYMDNRCKAVLVAGLSTFDCRHCSADCLVSQAVIMGKNKGYDVYILPGGSCIRKVLSRTKYTGIFGVACGDEMKLADSLLGKTGIKRRGLPLVRNGCADTAFDIGLLKKLL